MAHFLKNDAMQKFVFGNGSENCFCFFWLHFASVNLLMMLK